MVSPFRSILLGVLLVAGSWTAADACGDKLLALGGGVSFERVFTSRHPGSLILFLSPESPLRTANVQLRLDSTLERAGHTVRTVNSRQELENSIHEATADLVITDWADARALAAELGGRVAILPVLVRSEANGSADELSDCSIDASKHKGRQVVRAVDQLLKRHGKGLPANCSTDLRAS